jgi:hypothetical protein
MNSREPRESSVAVRSLFVPFSFRSPVNPRVVNPQQTQWIGSGELAWCHHGRIMRVTAELLPILRST